MPTPERLSLPFEDWPQADRAAWRAAFTAGDIFDDCGRGLRLSEYSRRNYFFGYGRWLGFLAREHRDALQAPPLARRPRPRDRRRRRAGRSATSGSRRRRR